MLCRTVGIVRLLKLTGATGCALILVMPDILRMERGSTSSYMVAVTLMMVLDASMSVVR